MVHIVGHAYWDRSTGNDASGRVCVTTTRPERARERVGGPGAALPKQDGDAPAGVPRDVTPFSVAAALATRDPG